MLKEPAIFLLIPGLACLAGLAACTPAPQAAGESLAIALEPCQLGTEGLAVRVAADCGVLEVPEDPRAPDGGTIPLRVAIVPAVSRNPDPDPLFLLAGGPGQAATEAFLPLLPSLRKIRQERDLVMVDQRGTGRMSSLSCADESWDPAIQADTGAVLALVTECVAELRTDPPKYLTDVAAGDLDRVRGALGYERINLYGVSYGTRLALTYMRAFPERVRAAILDGVVPQDMAVGDGMAADAQRALDLLLARCAADAPCHERYPLLGDSFEQLLAGLAGQAEAVTVSHPTTAETTDVLLTREMAAGTVRALTYSPETTALVPLVVDSAGREGDFETLAAQLLLVSENMSGSINGALMLSILCAEDVPFFASRPPADESSSFLGSSLRESLVAMCDRWPVHPVTAAFKTPVSSAVPTLLLSGEADPVTPPGYGERAAETLSQSLHVVVPGMGHNVLSRGCISGLAHDFIVAGSIDGLDATCAQEVVAPPFFLSRTGPHP